MTNAELIQKIRAEIERLKGICTAQIKANPGQTFPFVMEMTGYDKLLFFLDTLGTEKPMQEGLDEEINRLWESFADEMEGPHNLFDIYARLARHFAKWQKEQMMKEAVKWLVDEDYDEQFEKGGFILGSVGIGYNGYYIPYSDLLKLPKED